MCDGRRRPYCDWVQYLEHMKRRTLDLALSIVLAKMRIYLAFRWYRLKKKLTWRRSRVRVFVSVCFRDCDVNLISLLTPSPCAHEVYTKLHWESSTRICYPLGHSISPFLFLSQTTRFPQSQSKWIAAFRQPKRNSPKTEEHISRIFNEHGIMFFS